MLNKKRSPLKSPSLRQPGQSLDRKIDDIFYEKIIIPVFLIFVYFCITAYEWVRYYYNTPPHPWFMTFFTLAVAIYFAYKTRKNWRELKNLKLGREGERIVGESLEELRGMGYKIFHDVVGENFNIDHVLVGSGGVFTVETKTISKMMKGNPQISYDGINIKIDGFTPDRDPIKQAKGQMFWLENFIAERAKLKIKVKPVVLYPGWYINQKSLDTEVWVLNEKSLPSFLNNGVVVLTQEQINLISSHIDSYMRNK